MVVGGKSLTFDQGNTHEGMKWIIIDKATRLPIDLTSATITVLIKDIHETYTIINRVATIIDPLLGSCKLVPVTGEMDIPGDYKVQLDIVFGDTTTATIGNMQIVIRSVMMA